MSKYWEMIKKRRNALILIFGIFFSIILRFAFPESYYHSDIQTFISWVGITDNFSELYNTSCVCNYPIVGLLFSAGLLKLLGNSIFIFLLLLGLIDGLIVLLSYYILSKTNTENAGIYACLIGILPSTWAPGSFWGQIDNLGLLIVLGLIALIYTYNAKGFLISKLKFSSYIIVLSIVFTIGILSKQLLYFSLLALALLILTNILIRTNFKLGKTMTYITLFVVVMLGSIFLIDRALVLPDEYVSHLHRVALNGSGHVGKISGNGFNLWMLLDREMASSSTIPFFYSLSPLLVGMALFAINFLLLTYYFVVQCGLRIRAGMTKELLAMNLYYIALVNLAFNIFLSGTHERYLIYFYPIILMAMLIKRNGKVHLKSDVSFVLVLVGSLVYGFFVLGLMLNLRFNSAHLTVLLINLILYLVLIIEFKEGASFKLFKEQLKLGKRSHK